jgi:hypothetical protein
VPVKLAAAGSAAKDFNVKGLAFIEPGYLVLDGDGKELARVDQIVSSNPEWFEAPLRRLGKQPAEGFVAAPALKEAWDAYRRGDLAGARARCEQVLAQKPAAAIAAEARFLNGACLCRSNQKPAALQAWRDLGKDLPEEPWSWKAAMEAEDHGPFVHGFEDFVALPAMVSRDLPTDGSRAPVGTYTEAQLWQRSTQFLLAMDDGDGTIRDSIYDFGGTDGLPNVYAAVTALAGTALLEADLRAGKGLDLGAGSKERIAAMLRRIRLAIADPATVNTDDRDEIVWAYAYRARFLSRWLQLQPAHAGELAPLLQQNVDRLQQLQKQNGVWFHEYDNPFVVATALQSLAAAKAAGSKVDQVVVDKGVLALLHCRAKNGAYSYGYSERGEAKSTLEFGAGRMPHGELALSMSGKGSQDDLRNALNAGLQFHGLLAAVRKYDDHAGPHHIGGFFFWYDMLARSEAVMVLQSGAERGRMQAQQKKLVLDLPEFDGCFVDSHELGKAYGTAMGLLCLAALTPE